MRRPTSALVVASVLAVGQVVAPSTVVAGDQGAVAGSTPRAVGISAVSPSTFSRCGGREISVSGRGLDEVRTVAVRRGAAAEVTARIRSRSASKLVFTAPRLPAAAPHVLVLTTRTTRVTALVTTTGPICPATAPRSVRARIDGASLTVTWQAPIDDGGARITRYRLELAPAGGVFSLVDANVPPTGRFRAFVPADEDYRVRLAAVTSSGVIGAWSKPASVRR